ncbi:hypothetical protein GJT81_01920 [Enterobacteriaceae endosymbiont of Plateumaris consimilis]|uniref:SufD family Fe-S cluster assembly protein n=1 Tax=Enterobacteriaceae endosymbiont of Plateumaris consimilis TaxID=2675794 RepID=UPI001448D45D|nr:SufD family Fe-S cluster assembly protein [Enterobacteriaceae endosymbiont of Plateumaris consimilis]QJC28756.1 hypothetical protein GJT81_01920 [Enterobacteriaceae endosymbiont of Plateumaris consimilis]
MVGLMSSNNILKQLNNIYQLHKKKYFSKNSEYHWLKLKNLLHDPTYVKKNIYLNIINDKLLKIPLTKEFLKKDLVNVIFQIDAVFLYFINGKLNKNISDINNIYYKITINQVNNLYYKNISIKHNMFTHLSEALSKEIIFININLNNISDIKPLYLIYINIGKNSEDFFYMSNYRNYIDIQQIQSITIFEHYININQSYFNNIYTTLILGNNVNLIHYKLITGDKKNYYCANNEYYLNNNSYITKYDFLMSNKIIHQNNNFQFNGNNSTLNYKSLSLSKGNNISYINSYLEHNKKYCYSNQLHKAIVADNSIVNFKGLLKINPLAIKTDGQMNYSGLLLNKFSEINIKPELDIFNDDVKCKHGVFSGKIDNNQLFFLRTRGINLKKSHNMLLLAFLVDLIQDICDDNFKKEIYKYISNYFFTENIFNEFQFNKN